MNEKIIEGLEICKLTTNYLKDNNFNDIMGIKDNTIVVFTSKSRLCKSKSMNGSFAHYHNTKPHRVCIKQKALLERQIPRTKDESNKRPMLNGNYALVELMGHELAHHKTKGHGKRFHIKYRKFMTQLSLWIISGKFYKDKDLYSRGLRYKT